jgi:hypothetical protein
MIAHFTRLSSGYKIVALMPLYVRPPGIRAVMECTNSRPERGNISLQAVRFLVQASGSGWEMGGSPAHPPIIIKKIMATRAPGMA